MKNISKILAKALTVFLIATMISCNKDDGTSGRSVSDPEGTIITNIRNDDYSNHGLTDIGIGTLAMTSANVIGGYRGCFEVAYIGTVNGIGSIKSLPSENSFTGNGCAALEKGGYVLRSGIDDNKWIYARLYIPRFLKNTAGGIIGAEIKYQYPFEP